MRFVSTALGTGLPAPTTLPTTQSYTDGNGTVWVANSTVNGGIWRQARDVLHSQVYRSAAYVMPTANTTFGFDTIEYDAYGMWQPGANQFTLPVSGYWLCTGQFGFTPTAANQWGNIGFVNTGTGIFASSNALSTGTFAVYPQCNDVILLGATSAVNMYVAASGAFTGLTGLAVSYFSIDYLGSS